MSKTETSRLCVGVDLHKTQFTVCALSDDGEYLLEKKYPTKEEGYNEFSSEMHNREEQGYSIELAVETPAAPINTKWVYKLGSSDVTPTWGTAVTGYTDLTNGADIAASTNTKASVVLVFKDGADADKPIDYQNVTLVKHA